MNIDVSLINKTDILPNIPLIGLGKYKKNNRSQIDCYDCDNCYSGSIWVPGGRTTTSNCQYDCDYDCDCDCNNDCDCDCDDREYNCYWGDDDDWYPGGWDALCGSDCDY